MDWIILRWLLVILVSLIIIIPFLYHRKLLMECRRNIERYKIEGDKRYRDLANLLPQLVVELDASGHFTFINDAGLEFIGYTKYEVKNGINIFDIIHPDDLNDFKEEFMYLMEGGINKGQEFRVVTKKKSILFVVLFLKVIDAEGDSHNGLRGFIIDISDRKKLERKVLSAVLETEDKERQRFSEDLHDGLGPLLSTVKLYVNQMKSSKVTKEEEKEMLDYANELLDDAIRTTRNIANNILPGSIVDNGLIPTVSSFCNHVRKAGNIKVELNHNIKDRLGDNIEINLYRIVIELVNNSIKHADANDLKINIFLDKDSLMLEYYDNGIGFDVDKVKHGLGLNNVCNRAQSLNGEYQLDSEPGIGMHFHLTVKLWAKKLQD